jgi:hypothetical protein
MAIANTPTTQPAANSSTVLVEAEQFASFGGWSLDQQSMDQMGSPYLLAHGLGDPVADATTTVTFPAAGDYHVWVRTRDWVAPWKVPGAPGKFQLIVDGKTLPVTFGIEGAQWNWQDGGTVTVGSKVQLALHDLTGFEGRCDAIVFSRNPNFLPPNDLPTLTAFRRLELGIPDAPEDGGHFDLVVVGGGLAGTCAALSAARLGMTVALIEDRPVLGGNGSSEVRVWPEGLTNQKPYVHVGDVVRELLAGKKGGNASKNADAYGDQQKLDIVKAEPRITLMLDERVNGVEASGGKIQAVIAQHIITAHRYRVTGTYFADCTGDGTVGALGGADFDMTMEGHMGDSNLWGVQKTAEAEPFPKCLCQDHSALGTLTTTAPSGTALFPRCPWAVDLHDKEFPGRKNVKGQWKGTGLSNLGDWFWESGFDRDPINDIEETRDLNLRAMYGAWDTLKNVDGLYPNYKIGWAAYIAGKRESRRLMGDVILTADDFRKMTKWNDAAFPCSWHIDLHLPDKRFASTTDPNAFIARATEGKGYEYSGPYWAPYRCLYSRNISNLFMAGRDISVAHDGLGAVRVMQTCGMMGEIVGMAASVCKAHNCTPREVYYDFLPDLQAHINSGVGRKDLTPASSPG